MVATAMLAFAIPAKADYVVWTDVDTGAHVSYPDTWKTINNQQPDDIITLSLPSGEDKAVCRLRAREDRRFVVYPNRFRDEIRDTNFSNNFWEDYTASYENVSMIRQQNEAGLGQGYASMTLISFITPPDEPLEQKAGLMVVTNYGDKVYVAECTSSAMSYKEYHTAFMSFFKTINFKPAYSVTKVGDYRNFLKDWGTINVPLANTVSRSVY
ncbi:MAG TPA: hypothetical protein PLK94_05070 [Alphaproteobacteria bacterium]|nr:hypothetical protein [Alphaproteobacteria bacterium]HOO50645.1 hypothetical protein [Alphaproteobacteria bacterium]